jgi:hypothetical protein
MFYVFAVNLSELFSDSSLTPCSCTKSLSSHPYVLMCARRHTFTSLGTSMLYSELVARAGGSSTRSSRRRRVPAVAPRTCSNASPMAHVARCAQIGGMNIQSG